MRIFIEKPSYLDEFVHSTYHIRTYLSALLLTIAISKKITPLE